METLARPIPSKFRQASILVVDEERGSRQALRDVLLGMGFSAVFTATNSREALMEIGAHSPSIILVDYRLSKVDGLSFTERLRRSAGEINPAVPVILMARSIDADLVQRARDAGVNEIVMKPISMQVLVRRLLHTLNKQRPLVRAGGFVGPDRRRRDDRRAGERRHLPPENETPEERRARERRGADRRQRQAITDDMQIEG